MVSYGGGRRKRSLGVCRRFLRAYIEAQNLELVAHCLHESVELLVDGQRGMPVRGRNEVCRALSAVPTDAGQRIRAGG